MGSITPFTPFKLFMGLLYNTPSLPESLLEALTASFGAIDFKSDSFSFSHSTYYQKEMGDTLSKCFISFLPLWDPSDSYRAKELTTQIEMTFSQHQHRQFNIDPGFLSFHNVSLLSTKNFSHRIPLQHGIYSELTLCYQQNRYQPLPWTYPDYQTDFALETFSKIRYIYKYQLKN